MISTGLRLGEVAALTWKDVQRSTNTSTGNMVWFILVNKTRYYKNKIVQDKAKAGSNGSVPISPNLVEKLEQWKAQAQQLGHDILSDNVIFPTIAQNQRGFTKMLVILSDRLGIRRTTAHCLRHSSVTFLASNGHDLQHVQKFARHTSVNMTRAYFSASHLNMEGMAMTMEKLFIPIVKLG